MKRIKFKSGTDGFYGVYFENPVKTNSAMIIMLGNDAEGYISCSAAKWAMKKGLNAMTVSPERKENGYHNFPLEAVEAAVKQLKSSGNDKIAVVGASTTGTAALAAASYISDITLTIAVTPSDFMWEGVIREKKDGCSERPAEGTALLSYKGEALPYMPFVYRHPEYWNSIKKESEDTDNFIAARRLYDDSEKAHPISEEEFIKVENINGMLVLAGAEDDALWDTVKYIRRMENRLKSRPRKCKFKVIIYEHGTHFLFPESLAKKMLPAGMGALLRFMFRAGREYPEECREARTDFDKKISAALRIWKKEK